MRGNPAAFLAALFFIVGAANAQDDIGTTLRRNAETANRFVDDCATLDWIDSFEVSVDSATVRITLPREGVDVIARLKQIVFAMYPA